MEMIKRSRKSKMKKRPDDWEQLKQEIAEELGLWDKVKRDGWSGLSAEDSGRLGGVFSARKKALLEMMAADRVEQETVVAEYAPDRDFNILNQSTPSVEEVTEKEIFPLG